MFKIEGKQINITRGDSATIKIKAKNKDGSDYTFSASDVVRLNVFDKKNNERVLKTKDVTATAGETEVSISIDKNFTSLGIVDNKPVVFWYEIILNPGQEEQTIICYDTDGAAEFVVYPEGNEEAPR